MEQAYITGATGTIGMALTGLLLDKGVNVRVFVRKESERSRQFDIFSEQINKGRLVIDRHGLEEFAQILTSDAVAAEVTATKNAKTEAVKPKSMEKSLLDRELTELTKSSGNFGRSVFYHLGWTGTFGEARNDRISQEKNIEYTLSAVRLAKRYGCDTFIGAGSQAEYGRVSGILTPDTPANPENEYGRCKLIAGIESRRLCEEYNIRHQWVRILSIFGPYDGSKTMVMSLISRLKKGERAELTQGIQTWDYLYSEEAAKALYLLGISRKPDAGVYCLGSGRERPLREYIEDIADAVGADRALLDFGAVPYQEKQVMRLCADITRLSEDTGFIPQISFAEGIRRTIEWYDRIKGTVQS